MKLSISYPTVQFNVSFNFYEVILLNYTTGILNNSLNNYCEFYCLANLVAMLIAKS